MSEIEIDPEDLLDQNHDWSPWGRDRWKSWGEAAKCRRQQIRYAALRWRGISEVEAARRSLTNAPKNHLALRQAAFRLETSKGVVRLLEMVTEQVGRGTGPLSEAEARIILSDISRGGKARCPACRTDRRGNSRAHAHWSLQSVFHLYAMV
jgi:hypothetical protein